MTEQTPKLDVPTLEYIVSMLEAEKEAYREGYYKADTPVIRTRRCAIFTHMISLKREITDLIEAQQEVA